MNAIVRDVMTPDVITVSKDTSFEVIAAALREHRVSAFPVLDEASQVIGVVSESDLLAKLALGLGDDEMPGMITGIVRSSSCRRRAVTAAELMTSPRTPCGPDTVEQAARIMYLRNVKRLPSSTRTAAWPGSSAAPTCSPCTAAPTPTSPRRSGPASCRPRRPQTQEPSTSA